MQSHGCSGETENHTRSDEKIKYQENEDNPQKEVKESMITNELNKNELTSSLKTK